MDFRLRLVVGGISQLPEGCQECSLVAGVEWRGREKKAGLLARGVEKNYTCRQRVRENGTAVWNEGFDHTCRFKRERSPFSRNWIVALQIKEVEEKGRGRLKKIGKAEIDVAEFVQSENEKNIRLPINCRVRGQTAEALLMVKLQIIKLESLDRSRTRGFYPYSLSRRAGKNSSSSNNGDSRLTFRQSVDSSSPKPSCQSNDPALHGNLLVPSETTKVSSMKKTSTMASKQKRRSIAMLFSCTNPLTRTSSSLNRACAGEDGINNGSRHKSCVQFPTRFKQVRVRPEVEEKLKFEPGHWERRRIVSRDGKLELAADAFLASIDQCSKRAAGGSACTVLAAVVADWLHDNPKSLPDQSQLDELVLKGSFQWRNLCEEENNKVKFSDKHFDLDTVLEEKVRSLAVVTNKSTVGFFAIDGMPEAFDYLQAEMSFDAIWNEILCTDGSEEKIYIASWNDHFFVLKVERGAIYLLDTLGERLVEGCNQAYILKFDEESEIYYRHGEDDGERRRSQDLVAEGLECCKEYIKGFLSAVPLSGLRQDIERGRVKEELLHRLLQIDFHFTAPCAKIRF